LRRARARNRGTLPARRRGVQVLELILVTPVIVILLVATVQFGSVHIIQSAVTHSATVGAREGAQGATVEEIAVEVDEVLAPHGIDVIDGTTPGAGTWIVLEVEDAVTEFGDLSFDPPTPIEQGFSALAAGEVRVTVYVKLEQTPVVNVEALKNFGFTFPGDYFQVSSVTKLE
jgi:hypothetical protein